MSRPRALRPVALEYIRDRLRQGRTLSSLLLRLNLAIGQVWTYLPPEIDEEMAHQLTQGGIARSIQSLPTFHTGFGYLEPVMTPSTPQVIALIQRFLQTRAEAYCVFEAALAKLTDPVILRQHEQPYFFFDDEVYYFLTGQDLDAQRIDGAIRAARSYLLTGVLTTTPPGSHTIQARQPITLQELQILVERTEMIVVGAYDGEGFVIWSRAMGELPTS